MKEVKATHLKAYRLNKNRFLLVSHPHYPSRFPYFNRLYALICFHIGTINLAFRRVRVCVCLVGFASLQSPWAHTLRHPCLFMNALLALRPCKAFGRSFQASLPCLPLPLHRTFPFPQPSQKHINRFVPHHVLASLVKGEVLSPEKFRATTGGIVTPPTFFKTALSLAPHHALASLVKGEVLSPEKICATTGGIAPYPHHQ